MKTTTTATAEKDTASVLILPRVEKKAPRAYIVGMTDTGKSTLIEVLMKEYHQAYSLPNMPVRTLIIDTKPRFKAEREVNGLSTELTGRYKRWGYGSGVLPNSYVLTGRDGAFKDELDQVWRLGGNIAIASAETKAEWGYVSRAAKSFYESYGAEIPRLLIVDELADFFEQRSLGDIFQRVARNGRERDCALIAGSQRPRKVPVEVMTEMKRLYMFELQYEEDLDHIRKFGLPRSVMVPDGHVFFMYDRGLKLKPPSNMYYELDLSQNYWTGGAYNGQPTR